MIAEPTKFNAAGSGVLSTQPEPLTADELNRLVNARSLKGTDTGELLNERPHQKEKELKMIPGIGPVMAGRIIAARPFRSADDLKKVNGIGDKKYAKIRPYFQ